MQICIRIIVTTILFYFAKFHENMKNKKGIFITICFPKKSLNFEKKNSFYHIWTLILIQYHFLNYFYYYLNMLEIL
jgi:hypothetical protein